MFCAALARCWRSDVQLLADAAPAPPCSAGDVAGFAVAMRDLQRRAAEQRTRAAQDEIDMMNADPFDPKVQVRLQSKETVKLSL